MLRQRGAQSWCAGLAAQALTPGRSFDEGLVPLAPDGRQGRHEARAATSIMPEAPEDGWKTTPLPSWACGAWRRCRSIRGAITKPSSMGPGSQPMRYKV